MEQTSPWTCIFLSIHNRSQPKVRRAGRKYILYRRYHLDLVAPTPIKTKFLKNTMFIKIFTSTNFLLSVIHMFSPSESFVATLVNLHVRSGSFLNALNKSRSWKDFQQIFLFYNNLANQLSILKPKQTNETESQREYSRIPILPFWGLTKWTRVKSNKSEKSFVELGNVKNEESLTFSIEPKVFNERL